MRVLASVHFVKGRRPLGSFSRALIGKAQTGASIFVYNAEVFRRYIKTLWAVFLPSMSIALDSAHESMLIYASGPPVPLKPTTITIITVFLGPGGGVEKERLKQTRFTHSGAEKMETLNKKLWEKQRM